MTAENFSLTSIETLRGASGRSTEVAKKMRDSVPEHVYPSRLQRVNRLMSKVAASILSEQESPSAHADIVADVPIELDEVALIQAAREKSGKAIASVMYFILPEERGQAEHELAQVIDAASRGLDYSTYSDSLLHRIRPAYIERYNLEAAIDSIVEAAK